MSGGRRIVRVLTVGAAFIAALSSGGDFVSGIRGVFLHRFQSDDHFDCFYRFTKIKGVYDIKKVFLVQSTSRSSHSYKNNLLSSPQRSKTTSKNLFL